VDPELVGGFASAGLAEGVLGLASLAELVPIVEAVLLPLSFS
jgi:hypothetical protein